MNRVILITGGNSGIGLHLASALLEGRERVAVLDLNGDNLATLAERYGDRLKYICCDVSNDQQARTAVASVVADWGRIDVLINNACLCQFGPLLDREPADRQHEFAIDYFGYVNMIAAAVPYMKQQGGGTIHNMSSGIGITGFPGIATYASAKGAIEALTRSLALELGEYAITVNLMHPPLTRTPSATPLGVPPQAMADPAVVGRKLAKKVGSSRPVIAPDLSASFGLFMMRLFPTGFGRLLAKLTARARAGA